MFDIMGDALKDIPELQVDEAKPEDLEVPQLDKYRSIAEVLQEIQDEGDASEERPFIEEDEVIDYGP